MDEIIAPWAEFASLPMYQDEEITWWSRNKSSFLEKTIIQLEIDTGINFERVSKKKKAEIRHKTVKKFDDPFQTGNAYWHPNNPVWLLKTKKGKKHRSTQIHELGHALGLQHPDNHNANTDTVMSYARDRKKKEFFERDVRAITRIFTDPSLKFADTKIGPVEVDELTGLLFTEYI